MQSGGEGDNEIILSVFVSVPHNRLFRCRIVCIIFVICMLNSFCASVQGLYSGLWFPFYVHNPPCVSGLEISALGYASYDIIIFINDHNHLCKYFRKKYQQKKVKNHVFLSTTKNVTSKILCRCGAEKQARYFIYYFALNVLR